jgi:hypothetical protein
MSHCGERGRGGKGREEGTKSLFMIPARGYTQFYVPRWVVKCALLAPESYDKSLCYHNTTFHIENQVVLLKFPEWVYTQTDPQGYRFVALRV